MNELLFSFGVGLLLAGTFGIGHAIGKFTGLMSGLEYSKNALKDVNDNVINAYIKGLEEGGDIMLDQFHEVLDTHDLILKEVI